MSDVAAKVRALISGQLDVPEDKLLDDAKFVEDLGADSLDVVELVMQFEEQFHVEIPDDAAEKLLTVGDAIKFIEANAK